MDPRTEQLVQHLYANPRDPAALEAVTRHLRAGRKMRSMAKVLEWWSKKAPTAADAAQALFEAAEAVDDTGQEPDRAFDLALRAMRKWPAHEMASRKVEAHLVARGAPREAVDLLREQEAAANAIDGDPGLRGRLQRRIGRLLSEHLDDRDGAIDAYEQALALGNDDVDIARELGQLLVDRADEQGPAAGRQDRHRAAELYTRFARGLDDDSAIQWLEAALDLAPDHDEALSTLEALVPDMESDVVLPRRWVAFIQDAPDGAATDARRARLAKRYIAAGRIQEAIACLEPAAAKGQRKVQTAIERLRRRVTERPGRPEPPPTAELPALPAAAAPSREDLSRMSLLSDLRSEERRDLAALGSRSPSPSTRGDDVIPEPPSSHPAAATDDAATRHYDPSTLAAAARKDETEIDDFLGRVPPAPPAPAPRRPAGAAAPPPAAATSFTGRGRGGSRGPGRRGAPGVLAPAAAMPSPFADPDEDAPTIALADELEGEVSGVASPEAELPPEPDSGQVRKPRTVPPVREPAPPPDAPVARREVAPPPDGFEPLVATEPDDDEDDDGPYELFPLRELFEDPDGDGVEPGRPDGGAPVVELVRSAGDHAVDSFSLKIPGQWWRRKSSPFVLRKALRGPGAVLTLREPVDGVVRRGADGVPEDLPPSGGKVELDLGDGAEIEHQGLTYRVKVLRSPKQVFDRDELVRSMNLKELGASLGVATVLVLVALIAMVSSLNAAGVDLTVEDRSSEEIFAEIRSIPPEERPEPPPPPRPPRPVRRTKSEQPQPPQQEPRVRIPQNVSKRLKQISEQRSGDSTDRALAALTTPNAGPGESLSEAVSNIDAVEGGASSGAFRIGGTLAALEGSSGVNIASSGGGDVGTLGGSAATKNAGKLQARQGRVRGRVRGVRALTRVSGSLSRGDVTQVINRALGRIQGCYERTMTRSGATFSGQIRFSWTVTTSGRVSGLREASNTLGNRQVSTCVARVIRGLRFPRPSGGPAQITYPFMFQSQ